MKHVYYLSSLHKVTPLSFLVIVGLGFGLTSEIWRIVGFDLKSFSPIVVVNMQVLYIHALLVLRKMPGSFFVGVSNVILSFTLVRVLLEYQFELIPKTQFVDVADSMICSVLLTMVLCKMLVPVDIAEDKAYVLQNEGV